jgi:hypothetical protein
MSKNSPRRIAVIGCSWLAAEMLVRLTEAGFEACLITEPGERTAIAAADCLGLRYTVKDRRVPLIGADLPWCPDLILSAHSFRILPSWFIRLARLGAIGYHPSLLPAYPGRHAIRDCLADGQRMTGGTVYWLTDQVDGGPVVIAGGQRLQGRIQILPGETALQLWKRALAPLGADLLLMGAQAISPP